MKRATAKRKFDHVPISAKIVEKPIDAIRPAPENELLYRPVSASDPDVISLRNSIKVQGVLDPLVITLDGYILSGHRRHKAAKMAGLKTVPCRVASIDSDDPRFVPMLRECNRQRVKSADEIVREQVLDVDPEDAHWRLAEHRRRCSRINAPDAIAIEGRKHRAQITSAKTPFLDAIIAILENLRDYWPLSVRQVHYQLLNAPPLMHARKPVSCYGNTQQSYKNAVDLITRARLAGFISWNAIDDETRPVAIADVHRAIGPFVARELGGFLKGYCRDLLQSQPNQIEIVGEKNTVANILWPVAAEYCAPLTIGRGYCSLPPRQKMAARFIESGKRKLILLVLSDFDPEGEDIAHSFARSMRDDFGIEEIVPIKVALTREQVDELNLPPMMKAKEASSRHDGFVEKHGDDVFELEAVLPAELQRLLRKAIDSVLDVAAYNREFDAEKKDAAHLEGVRRAVQQQLAGLKLGDGPR